MCATLIGSWHGIGVHFCPQRRYVCCDHLGMDKYKQPEIWKFTAPMDLRRTIALSTAAAVIFPVGRRSTRGEKDMVISVLLFIVGLVCLIKGGDWFVDGATGIARKFHLPELLIGATVVSIGTTLPEVMVSTTSALTGHSEIAYGNAIAP